MILTKKQVIDKKNLYKNTLLVYGMWDSFPGWKELRQAYERTFGFIDQLMNLEILN